MDWVIADILYACICSFSSIAVSILTLDRYCLTLKNESLQINYVSHAGTRSFFLSIIEHHSIDNNVSDYRMKGV